MVQGMDSHTLPRTERIRSCPHPFAVKHRGIQITKNWWPVVRFKFRGRPSSRHTILHLDTDEICVFLSKDSKRCSVDAYTISFFLPKNGVVPVPQHDNNTQQIISIIRNHVERGQPPVSVVVAVVVVQPPVVDTDIEMAPAILVNVCVM